MKTVIYNFDKFVNYNLADNMPKDELRNYGIRIYRRFEKYAHKYILKGADRVILLGPDFQPCATIDNDCATFIFALFSQAISRLKVWTRRIIARK